MSEQEYKQFSLHEEGMWYVIDELPPMHLEAMFHAIEYKAYQAAQDKIYKLEKQNEIYRKALRMITLDRFEEKAIIAEQALKDAEGVK